QLSRMFLGAAIADERRLRRFEWTIPTAIVTTRSAAASSSARSRARRARTGIRTSRAIPRRAAAIVTRPQAPVRIRLKAAIAIVIRAADKARRAARIDSLSV